MPVRAVLQATFGGLRSLKAVWTSDLPLEERPPARNGSVASPEAVCLRPTRTPSSREIIWIALAVLIAATLFARIAVPAFAASGPALVFSAPQLIDHEAPYGQPVAINSIACPSTALCVATSEAPGQIISTTNPAGSTAGDWSVLATSLISQGSTGYALAGATCVTTQASPFCVATGRNFNDWTNPGVILTSSNPTGNAAAWQKTAMPRGLTAKPSCAYADPTTMCAVATGFARTLYTSTNPAGGATSWTTVTAQFGPSGYGVSGVACPSTSLCAATSNGGEFVSSGNPTNAAAWSSSSATGLTNASGLSCPTTTFCLVTGSVYNDIDYSSVFTIATTTNPQAGAGATWTTSSPSALAGGWFHSIDCSPDSALASPHAICFAHGDAGKVEVSIDGGSSWTAETLGGSTTEAAYPFSCPTHTLCVGGTYSGSVVHSADAFTGAAATWSAPLQLAGGTSAMTLGPHSCPSVSLCVASDRAGRVLTSADPAGGPTAWSSSVVSPGSSLNAPVCPSATLCVATGGVPYSTTGIVVTSTDPAAGGASWSSPATIDNTASLDPPVCPSTSLCLAADWNGQILTSTNPAGGGASWSSPEDLGSGVNSIENLVCPSTTLCVASDYQGHILTSTNPAGGGATWSVDDLGGPVITRLACPSTSLCVAFDGNGEVLTSSNPAGGGSTWSAPLSVGPVNGWVGDLVCPSTTFCAATDSDDAGAGGLLVSTNPAGGGASWSYAVIDASSGLDRLICPSSALCAAASWDGGVLTSANPAGGANAWSAPSDIYPLGYINSFTCVATALCLITDGGGHLITATPSSPPPDTTAPAISNISPASGFLTTNASITLTYTATDDSGTPPICSPASGSSIPLNLGSNMITITCTDAAANSANSSVVVTREAPQGTTSPAPTSSPPILPLIPLLPALPDTTAPKVKLSGKSSQRLGKAKAVVVTVTCNEDCTLKATGQIVFATANKASRAQSAARQKVIKLAPVTVNAKAGTQAQIRFKLSKKQLAILKRAFKAVGKASLKVVVTAKDAAANADSARLTLRVKP